MASVDQLQIEITSNATSASSAIKDLTSSLQKLNAQLGLKDGAKLTTLLQSLADAADTFSGKINNIGGFDNVTKGADEASKAMQNVTEQAEQFSEKVEESTKKAFDGTPESFKEFKFPDLGTGIDTFDKAQQKAEKAKSEIEQATEAARTFRKVISDMESGKTEFDPSKYKEAVQGYARATEAVKNYKNELLGIEKKQPKMQKSGDVISNFVALGEALDKVSQKFNMVAEKGMKMFSTLTSPLRAAANEYVEKFRNMAEHVSDFRKHFQAQMGKISQFWKRTMKTFTFMIVRKAITAIIKEVGNAVQSLAMYSNAMGTAFNTDISNMVADFQFLGRSIISVFAPLLNIIAPIIDAIVSRIATLLSYIGMLIAALGGKATFTKAKKNVGNYAESLDQASKSAKNLTMGIDELNIISEKSGGGGAKPYDGWEDGWEDVDIPAGIKGIADKLKKMWDDFFGPIKTAWDRAKQYVYDGFKTMIDSLSKLGGHVWDDFITMWNQEKTIRMLEQMFRIIGDIFRVVRNLADAFDEAWQKGKVGLKIFENLRDIAATLVDHLRNVTYYMIQWAEGIDFSPLLQSFEKLTGSLTKVADFIGGVFEDIMIDGVLEYIEYMIEEGVPHLQNTLAEVFNTFNFNALRKNLDKIWIAFEKMFERIHKGTTDAIGNLGKMVARFTNSKTFTDFLQRLVDITKLITAERVEKVLTGLGKGILNIAESVIKFINSDAFMKFLEVIADWIDNHSVDQIAGILTNIANAILIFKFGAFAAEKLAGFFQFFTVIKALTNLSSIAKGISGLGTSLGEAGAGAATAAASGSKLAGLGGGLSGLIPIIGGVVGAFLEFKGVSKSVEDLTLILNGGEGSLGWTIAELVAKVGIATAAFTLLFGPGGAIAGLAVGAVAALNGVNDAINQMNFDQVTNAIMTHGETTVQQVNEWYSQATSTVAEHTQKWKDIERNLTQDRKDLEEYSKTLEGLEAAFRGAGNAGAEAANKLATKYNDMTEATNHYIDETTEALVQDLIDNRKYYESKGKNVDDMIAKLYKSAEEEKKVYNDTQQAVTDAAKAYEDAVTTYGENSAKAEEAYKKYQDAVDKHIEAISRYREETDKIDTSEAVQHITELGKSLDLSQYNNWDEAAADIKGSLDEIQTTYETELTGINTTVQQKMEFLAQQLEEGRIDEEDYRLRVEQVTQQWTEDTNTLVDSTKQALDLYNKELALNLQDVATKAEEEWNKTNPFIRFFKMGTDKDAYIQSQMQTYVNQHLGETGLTGKLKEAYSVLPDNLQSTTLEAMTRLVNETSEAYIQAEYDIEDYTKEATKGSYQNVLNALPGMLDYVAPTGEIATQLSQAYDQSVGEIDYDPTGFKTVHQMGEALEQNKEAIIDPSINVANFAAVNLDTNLSDEIKAQTGFTAACEEYATQSATALNDTLIENTVNNTEIPSQLEEYGANTSGAFNTGFQSKTEETQGIITTWFENMNTWIHDNIHLPFGSPNKKTHEYGEDMVYGFNEGIDAVRTTTGTALGTWFAFMQGEIVRQMGEVKTLFNEKLRSIFSGEGLDVESPIAGLFQTVTAAILNQINLLGTTIQSTMATFMETYILPYFSADIWQPLFDLLHEETFLPNFERFVIWFDEEAMMPFWEEHMLPWFAAEKWDEDIFIPVKENIDLHWENFIEWWDKSIKEWWQNHLLKPWFQKTKWDTDVFIPLKDNIYKHWENFIKWWDKSIKDWWENHLIKPWFTDEKWDKDAFDPLKKNITTHWDNFIKWWDEAIKDWWENRVKPYFKKELWREQFNYVLETAKEVFNQVRDEITERINAAADAVSGACASMCQALQEVLDMIDRVMEAMANVGNIESSATVTFNTEFRATGGFVQGDLFVANEAGPELVGTIGGRTAVASNQEITGIADAVYATGNQESALLSQLISVTKQMLDKDPVVIGDRDIARMANNGQSQLGMSIIS